LNQGGTKRRDS